uniref:Apo-citrate lyase phosphoribosyl-dephospho-CoA transferase n=1 Tax=Siphoviridae sp. ctb1k4 TaxID=2826391 RepID=A0A8S5MUF3_9CAUD|nr:MAG TPA: Apo-citrate lyase phosphoribosyl-dephospho-CoA transferase [Siphoviridae sp. ctb1k4]
MIVYEHPRTDAPLSGIIETNSSRGCFLCGKN